MIAPLLLGSIASSLLALAPGGPGPTELVEAGAPIDPLPIVGGSEAQPCQWPSVVSLLENDETPVMCSGTLIHPEVVLTAAHCITPERPVVGLGFGEHGQATGVPARVVEPIECVGNPAYYAGAGADVAYCLLAQPVTDVPIVPLMAGCEVEELVAGTEVTIVGFGASYGTVDDFGQLQTSGVGTKRYTTQIVEGFEPILEEINLYDDSGSQSACFGDSGGPALVELADGSWRVFGTGSHLYEPIGGSPPPLEPGNICGPGAAYGFAPWANEWLESASGFDLTPCWDGEDWVAGPGCGGFPLEPDVGVGEWLSGCAGGSLGGGVAPVCADVRPPDGGSSSGDDGSGDGGSSDGTTTLDPTGELTTGPLDGSGSSTTGDPGGPPLPVPSDSSDDGGSSGGSSSAGLDDDTTDGGCSCRAASPRGGAPAALGLLGVLALLRRRRR